MKNLKLYVQILVVLLLNDVALVLYMSSIKITQKHPVESRVELPLKVKPDTVSGPKIKQGPVLVKDAPYLSPAELDSVIAQAFLKLSQEGP